MANYEASKAYKKAKKEIPQDINKLNFLRQAYDAERQANAAERQASFEDSINRAKGNIEEYNKAAKPYREKFHNSFYDALSGSFKQNAYDVRAAGSKNIALNYQNQKAEAEKQQQWHSQKANQNAESEAGKIANAQNGATNKQNISQNRNKVGKSIGRLRTTTTPDIMAQKNFSAEQMSQGENRSDVAATRGINAAALNESSEAEKLMSREYNSLSNEQRYLTRGGNVDTADTSADTSANNPAAQTTTPTTPAAQTTTTTTPAAQTTTPVSTASTADTPTTPTTPVSTASTVDTSANNPAAPTAPTAESEPEDDNTPDETDDMSFEDLMQYFNLTGQEGLNGNRTVTGKKFRGVNKWLKKHPDYVPGDQTQQWLDANGLGNRIRSFFTQPKPLKSDTRVKNVITELSDYRMKCIKEDWDEDGTCSPEDFIWLAERQGGKYKYNDKEYNFFNDDDWSDSDDDNTVLDGYAENIRNFLYTYKPEAVDIDPTIDPNEKHIGPMAQDIEKVNPACIKETSDGVKTVDTGRLALMNAGAIGDIARQLKDLTLKLEELQNGSTSRS